MAVLLVRLKVVVDFAILNEDVPPGNVNVRTRSAVVQSAVAEHSVVGVVVKAEARDLLEVDVDIETVHDPVVAVDVEGGDRPLRFNDGHRGVAGRTPEHYGRAGRAVVLSLVVPLFRRCPAARTLPRRPAEYAAPYL